MSNRELARLRVFAIVDRSRSCSGFGDLYAESVLSALEMKSEGDAPKNDLDDRQLRRAANRAACRLARQVRKQRQREVPLVFDLASDGSEIDEVLTRDLAERLYGAIMALPENARTVIELDRTGHSGKQIAERLGLSASRVSEIKARAIDSLRRILKGE